MDRWAYFMIFMSFCALAIIAVQPQQNRITLDEIKTNVDNFIERWDKRVETSNVINNQTQAKVEHGVEVISDNLIHHRIVTNDSRDHILVPLLNETRQLIKSLNTTNEEERGKAVDDILAKIDNDTQGLVNQLNETNQKVVANLTSQLNDVLHILKTITNSTSD